MRRALLGTGPVATTVGQFAAFAGGVHVMLGVQRLDQANVVSRFLIGNGAALMLAGGLVMLTGRLWAWRTAGSLAAVTVLAYLIARTAGLDGIDQGFRGIVSAGMVGLVALIALVAGLYGGRASTPPPEKDPAWLLALAARER